MKQTISWFLAFMILFSSASMIRSPAAANEEWENPYIDVTQDMWSYQYITELNRMGVLPSSDKLQPTEKENRGNLVLYLYNMDENVFPDQKKKRERAAKDDGKTASFTDVTEDSPYYDAVCWAFENGLVGGTTETTFSPDQLLTREQVCAIVARFAALEEISLIQAVEPDQFQDSLSIGEYARSGVTACQMAGVVKGYDDGYFYPMENMSRQECAAVIYRVMASTQSEPPEGVSMVDLTPGTYDKLYETYTEPTFEALVPGAAEEGPASYFDKTVFIGDSVSLTLESYCMSSGALGKAKFLCAGSMSASNMLTGKILPEYPKGSGKKPPIADSVAASGAKVVYIMLGMDNIAYGLERSTGDMVKVINSITAKNPNAAIVVQSVTPMADSSKSYTDQLNNDTINAYNARMKELCQENRWYYLDVAQAFKDGSGFLKKEYCSDYGKMGMHFNFEGAKIWVHYLKTHIPERLLGA